MPWRNPELVTGVERCLNEVSDALQRLARECDVLREDALGGRAVEPSGWSEPLPADSVAAV